MLNDTERQTNIDAIQRFLDFWKKRGLVQIENFRPIRFSAMVRYQWMINKVIQEAKVEIVREGQFPFQVRIEETGVFSVKVFHLSLSPDYQRIRVGKRSKALLIRGNSEKMGGDYRVRIKPTEGSLA